MDSYRLEKGFAHQHLIRWIEHYSLQLKEMNEYDANFLLASRVINSKLGDCLIPTATERAAADILAGVCAIEHSISVGEAMLLFNGVPTIIGLANSLDTFVNVLEKMTDNYPITKSGLATIESVNYQLRSQSVYKDLIKVNVDIQAEVASIKGMSKRDIAKAFDGIHFKYEEWGRNLADFPKWLEPCLVSKGSKKRHLSHLWNPVLIALALMDKPRSISVKRLDLVFIGLKDWQTEWQEKSEYSR